MGHCYHPFSEKEAVKWVKSLSCVRLFGTPLTVACQAPQPMGFSRQEYWSGLLFPSLGDLPDPGIEPGSLALQADSLQTELLSSISAFAVRIFEMSLRDKVFPVTYVTWMSAGVTLPSEIWRGLIQTSHPYHTWLWKASAFLVYVWISTDLVLMLTSGSLFLLVQRDYFPLCIFFYPYFDFHPDVEFVPFFHFH